jgi:hypothetical protein
MSKEMIYVGENDPYTLFVGTNMHNYLEAKRNLYFGSGIGANTRTCNNILIGVNLDGSCNEIKIDDNT